MHHHYKSAYGIGGYIIMTSLLVGAIQVPPTYHRCDLFGLDAPQQRLVSVRCTSQTLGGGRGEEGGGELQQQTHTTHVLSSDIEQHNNLTVTAVVMTFPMIVCKFESYWHP